MPTSRSDIEADLLQFKGWDKPHQEQLDNLLHQLTLLKTNRQNIALYLRQAELFGGVDQAPPVVTNSLPGLWQRNREIRSNYTTLARQYQLFFPRVDVSIQEIPEDVPSIKADSRL